MTETTSIPTRQGAGWDFAEYATLVQELRAGLSRDDIAARHGRTPGGITAQIMQLIPLDEAITKRAAAEAWLRHRLADPGYDWAAALHARYAAQSRHLWTPADDERLRHGWSEGTALPLLATACAVNEQLVVRRMMQIGIAESLIQVVDRLGCSAGGEVQARYLLAKDTDAALVHVLVIETNHEWRITVHGSTTAARQELQRQGIDPNSSDDPTTARWAITPCIPGGPPAIIDPRPPAT